LGEHIVTGENAREWRINVMRSSAEGRLSMIEALARKPHEVALPYLRWGFHAASLVRISPVINFFRHADGWAMTA
jgi:hypothetical protein